MIFDQQELLESYYDVLFEEQLAGWWTDEADWPEKRDLKMFLAWFEVEFLSLVFDLCEEPIRVMSMEMIRAIAETISWKFGGHAPEKCHWFVTRLSANR